MKLFITLIFLALLAGVNASGQSLVVPNQGLTDISEATYKSLTVSGRKDLGPGDPQLRVLPGISQLRWIVENNLVLHPKVKLIGAQRWAWLELAGSNAVLDPKSSLKVAIDQIRFEVAKTMLEQSGAVLNMQPVRTATISQVQTSATKVGEPNDPFFSRQREAIDLINVGPLWELDIAAPKAVSMSKMALVVMDTGLRCSHPDLSGIVDIANSRSFVDTPCDPTAPHGTQVAGVAAAVANNSIGIAGVSQGVPILDYEIFSWSTDTEGKPILYTTDEIMLRAFASILALPYELVVVNCSFQETDPYDPGKFWARTLWMLGDKALVIAGSGNESLNTSIRDTYPGTLSSLENVICLTTIDSQGRLAGFGGVGNKVELAAPGVNVFTTDDSVGGYITASGVSFSIPHASGVSAMLAKHAPKLPTPSELKQALLKGASLNLNLIGKMPEPRQLNGWRSWLAITGQLNDTPLLFSRVDYMEDGSGQPMSKIAVYSWVVAHGEGLASGYCSADQIPLPRTLCGVQVLVNGRPVSLLDVSPERIDVQMPNDFQMHPSPTAKHSLAIVRVDKEGNQIVGSQLVLPSFVAIPAKPAIRSLTSSTGRIWDQNPAKTGEQLVLWVTGLGRVDPDVQPGVPFDGTERVLTPIEMFFDGKSVPISVKTVPGAIGIFSISFTMLQVESMYSAKATLCSGDVCADFWFNYDGQGGDIE